jgi:hypothetical protein
MFVAVKLLLKISILPFSTFHYSQILVPLPCLSRKTEGRALRRLGNPVKRVLTPSDAVAAQIDERKAIFASCPSGLSINNPGHDNPTICCIRTHPHS